MFEEEYPDEASVPASVKHLYKEVDGGKFVIMGAGEIKTQVDVDRVLEGARKERKDHKATKELLTGYQNLGKPDELHEKLDRFEELEAASGGNLDEEKINTIVEARIKAKTAPLERTIGNLTKEREELSAEVGTFKTKETKRTIHDHIRKAAQGAKMRDTAVDDALLLGESVFTVDETGRVVTKDNVGVTPGIEAGVWLSEVKTARAHWWPESAGAGATGGQGGQGGPNPFSKDGWNMTAQGQLVTSDRNKAEQMARSAGTTIGGQRPEK